MILIHTPVISGARRPRMLRTQLVGTAILSAENGF